MPSRFCSSSNLVSCERTMTANRSLASRRVVIWSAARSFRSLPPLKPWPVLTLNGGTPTRGLATPLGGASYRPTFSVSVSRPADSLLDAQPPLNPAAATASAITPASAAFPDDKRMIDIPCSLCFVARAPRGRRAAVPKQDKTYRNNRSFAMSPCSGRRGATGFLPPCEPRHRARDDRGPQKTNGPVGRRPGRSRLDGLGDPSGY